MAFWCQTLFVLAEHVNAAPQRDSTALSGSHSSAHRQGDDHEDQQAREDRSGPGRSGDRVWRCRPRGHAQSVVVYSAVSPKVMSAFVEEFQKQNPGIKVELINGGSGELFTRLNAEKARPRADVLVGPDADNFDAYHRPVRAVQVEGRRGVSALRHRPRQQVLRLLDQLPGVHRQHQDDAGRQGAADVERPDQAGVQGQGGDGQPGAIGLGVLADAADPAALQLGHDGQDHRRRPRSCRARGSPTRTSPRARCRSGSPASSTSSPARPTACRWSPSIRRTARR